MGTDLRLEPETSVLLAWFWTSLLLALQSVFSSTPLKKRFTLGQWRGVARPKNGTEKHLENNLGFNEEDAAVTSVIQIIWSIC